MNLGQYATIRAQNIEQHRKKLLQQIAGDYQRKIAELACEKEVDSLRSECGKLEHEKTQMEEQQNYNVKVKTAQKDREKFLAEESLKKQQQIEIKRAERAFVEESDRKYKDYLAKTEATKKAIREQIAAELQSQMKFSSGHNNKSETPHLKGTCPHGKLYVCAFCSQSKK